MKEDESIESRIQQAMRSRVQHFRDQADSLTFEGVRRLLEKDLLLDTYALDVHKRYVKQLLEKYLSDTGEDASKGSEQIKLEEAEERQKDDKVTVTRSEDEGEIEDSPVMGLLSGNESAKAKDIIPNEDMIKDAIWKKAAYFKSKSEELTVAGVRRDIEDDLQLAKFSLDPFKKFISNQLDEVLNMESDTSHKTCSKSDADSSDIEVEVRPKKKLAPKGKVKKTEGPVKRKRPAKETQRARKKQTKHVEETSDQKNNDVDDESSAEKSESSAGKSVKKDVVAPVYGKKVERLKSIVKACGMSVAPTVYKKAKQVPEHKREAFLLKELEEVLSKEGLSTKPTEKEIKDVKRRKERAKELEGIDTSNIVLGSRRRSTSSFVPPPKPKAVIESDDDDSEDSDNDDGDESEDTGKDDGDVQDEDEQDEDDNVDAGQSEEVHEDAPESD